MNGKQIAPQLLIVLGLFSLLVVSCAPTAASIPTATPAPSATLTPTPAPTPTPQPTVDPFVLDLEKFHKFPESYEYLLAHRDEFVQSPDPVNDRAAFDRWFQEELVPALGPKPERPINLLSRGGGGGHFMWGQSTLGYPLVSLPPLFWFESSGTVFAVPCLTTTTKGYEAVSIITVCPALFDSATLQKGPEEAITAMNNGWDIDYIDILYDPIGYRSDLSWREEEQKLVAAIGDYPIDDNGVKFGFGYLAVFDR